MTRTSKRRARWAMALTVVTAVVGGCVAAPAESHLTVVNANPHRVTVIMPSATLSIAACGMAEFTFDGNWRPASGAGAPVAGEPQVYVYPWTPANEQGPGQVLDVVSGTSYIEYPASAAPSLPPCSAPSGSAAPSG